MGEVNLYEMFRDGEPECCLH